MKRKSNRICAMYCCGVRKFINTRNVASRIHNAVGCFLSSISAPASLLLERLVAGPEDAASRKTLPPTHLSFFAPETRCTSIEVVRYVSFPWVVCLNEVPVPPTLWLQVARYKEENERARLARRKQETALAEVMRKRQEVREKQSRLEL